MRFTWIDGDMEFAIRNYRNVSLIVAFNDVDNARCNGCHA